MELRVTDSRTGRPRTVRPSRGRTVDLYVCGPTVYDAAHVGHARTYLVFDVARRFLEAEGHRVRHVMNVTDVEDKIDRRAEVLGVSSLALARAEERTFFEELRALGNLPPRYRPRASAYVPAMFEVARALDRTGRVRRAGAEWIYEAPDRPEGENFPSGAELARHAVPEPGHPYGTQPNGNRAFVVWKLQDRPLPSWPSPWGRGVPGWHLECFAMASQLLRVPVDLHGGGRDLQYPHHFAVNEVARALRRTPFSTVHLHTGLVLQNGAKMSKSTGNLVPLREALANVGRGGLRWYLLGQPYRDRFGWSSEGLDRARAEFDLIRSTLAGWLGSDARGRLGAARAARLGSAVRAALARGLATERVVAELRALCAEIGSAGTGGTPRGERSDVRAALHDVEARTGLPLL